MAECPVCGADITLEADVEEGEIIACDDCGSELEVTGKDSLQEAPQEEEDWGEQEKKYGVVERWRDNDFGFQILDFELKLNELGIFF